MLDDESDGPDLSSLYRGAAHALEALEHPEILAATNRLSEAVLEAVKVHHAHGTPAIAMASMINGTVGGVLAASMGFTE